MTDPVDDPLWPEFVKELDRQGGRKAVARDVAIQDAWEFFKAGHAVAAKVVESLADCGFTRRANC